MAKRPRIGQPPKYNHRGGCINRSISMPKDLSEWLKEEAHRRSMKISALVVELLERAKVSMEEKSPVDKITDDLTRIANSLGATLIKEEGNQPRPPKNIDKTLIELADKLGAIVECTKEPEGYMQWVEEQIAKRKREEENEI